MKIKNLSSVYVFFGYGEPSFGLASGEESSEISDNLANDPAFTADVAAHRIEVSNGRPFIRLVNEHAVTEFFGYAEPSFQLAPGATSPDLPASFLSIPAVIADIADGIISVAESTDTDIRSLDEAKVREINVVDSTLVVTDGITALQLRSSVASTDGTTQTYAVTTGGDVPVADGDPVLNGYKLVVTAEDGSTHVHYIVVSGSSSSHDITSLDEAVVYGIVNTVGHRALSVAFGTGAGELKAGIRSSDYSVQTYKVYTNLGVEAADIDVVLTGWYLTVTAEDASTADFAATQGADPDIALVAADKASVTDAAIKGDNADLGHVVTDLELPATGTNGSDMTWVSSDTNHIDDNGIFVDPPLYSEGDATVTMTMTIEKGLVTDTKDFVATVTKAAASDVATVTSGTYTVSAGGNPHETIIGVAPGVPRDTFLGNLTKGNTYQTWNTSNISTPNVLDGDMLVVTAEDGSTQVIYTITVA